MHSSRNLKRPGDLWMPAEARSNSSSCGALRSAALSLTVALLRAMAFPRLHWDVFPKATQDLGDEFGGAKAISQASHQISCARRSAISADFRSTNVFAAHFAPELVATAGWRGSLAAASRRAVQRADQQPSEQLIAQKFRWARLPAIQSAFPDVPVPVLTLRCELPP